MLEDTFKKSSSVLYHPALHTFLFPFSLSLLGIVYAGRFTAIHFNSYLILYLFLFTNKLIENQSTKRVASSRQFFPRLNPLFELMNIGCLLYFFSNGSTWAVILPVSYTLAIHFQYLFLAYDLVPLALIILSAFKGISMHALAFYLQLNFIPTSLFIWCLPMIFPLLLLEENRWQRLVLSKEMAGGFSFPNSLSFLQKNKRLRIHALTALTFLAGMAALWSQAGLFSLLLLGLVPLVRNMWNSSSDTQKKKHQLFFLAFTIVYTLMLILTLPPSLAVK